jgi:hypothetical protein
MSLYKQRYSKIAFINSINCLITNKIEKHNFLACKKFLYKFLFSEFFKNCEKRHFLNMPEKNVYEPILLKIRT